MGLSQACYQVHCSPHRESKNKFFLSLWRSHSPKHEKVAECFRDGHNLTTNEHIYNKYLHELHVNVQTFLQNYFKVGFFVSSGQAVHYKSVYPINFSVRMLILQTKCYSYLPFRYCIHELLIFSQEMFLNTQVIPYFLFYILIYDLLL